ncbi:MAG TPA: hypothetical protein VGZ48_03665 [Candidatus Acidoferrales bacterium]|jgi:hypothetical protein|nr:hypothetical protein [Candidatus Acidoferrales bacterium]
MSSPVGAKVSDAQKKIMDMSALNFQIVKLKALKETIPPFIKQDFVNEYNKIVETLQSVTNDDKFLEFIIYDRDMEFKIIGSRPGSYSGHRSPEILRSSHKTCDENTFNRRLKALDLYLEQCGYLHTAPRSSPYPRSTMNVENMTMIGSAIQQGTTSSAVTIHFDARNQDFRKFIGKLRDSAEQLDLSPAQLREFKSDVATIEAQVASSSPKHSVIAECGRSLRAICEGVVSNVAAAALLPLLAQYFPK